MEIIQIVAIGIIAAILSLTLKRHNPEASLMISIAAGVIIFLMVIGKLSAVIETIRDIISKSNIDSSLVLIIFKIIGIAYIAEFGAHICKDAGESSIASKIELAGKVLILVISTPIIINLMELILSLLPAA